MRRKLLAVFSVVGLVAIVGAYVFGVRFIAPFLNGPALNRDIGAHVRVTGSRVPRNMKAVTISVAPPLANEFQTLGPTVDVTPSGPLPGPVTLQIQLNGSLTQGDIPIVATSESTHGPWTLMQPSISKDGRSVIVQTTHLSIFAVLGLIPAKVGDFLKSVFTSLTGNLFTSAAPPTCDKDIYNDPTLKQEGYSTSFVSQSARSALYWCFGIENNQPTLKIVNKLRYPIQVSHPGLTFLRDNGPAVQLELDQLARFAAGQDTILFPFEEADYAVNLAAGASVGLSTDFANLAEGLSIFQSMVESVLAVAAFVSKITVTVSQLAVTVFDDGEEVTVEVSQTTVSIGEEEGLLKIISTLLDVKDCANAVASDDVGGMIKDCIGGVGGKAVLDAMLGVIVAPIVISVITVSSIAESIRSFLDYAGDSSKLTAEYGVGIAREAAKVVQPPSQPPVQPPSPPTVQPPTVQPPTVQPPSSASIQIGWSNSHPTWIWMKLSGFAPGTYQYTCSFNTGGDRTFNVVVSSNPQTFDNAQTCYDTVAGDIVWVVINSIASNHIAVAAPPPPPTYQETAGPSGSGTFTNYTNAGGTVGQRLAAYQTVTVTCRVQGWQSAAAPAGDDWWYRVQSSPWDNTFYAYADNFYNNGQTSGSINNGVLVDTNVPLC